MSIGAGRERDPSHDEVEFLLLPFHKAIAELEKLLIKNALKDSNGNKSEAADRLQINRRLLYKKLTDYHLEE
jgi:DNA-binding NtrC family response regulator